MMTMWTKLFPINMSKREQIVRVVGGVVLIAVAIVAPTGWGWAGLYPLLTGFTGSSPVYRLLSLRQDEIGA